MIENHINQKALKRKYSPPHMLRIVRDVEPSLVRSAPYQWHKRGAPPRIVLALCYLKVSGKLECDWSDIFLGLPPETRAQPTQSKEEESIL